MAKVLYIKNIIVIGEKDAEKLVRQVHPKIQFGWECK